ncbi:MAG TPA: FAD:protein FMN transferase [Intrasporangium sp.]|uniref:FAD:protein FMN transferase n=1 Tax=Intrasporangium sp. TaxID=1925024 RepID=UPI002D78CA2C|nr:FAD:protein FMN transferase [Intrasporangium sp.]HET7399315.1 FAD:protein FMN transferase [Intrasporangium sp.]
MTDPVVSHGPPPRRAWVEHVMGMPVSIHVRGAAADSALTRQAVMAAYEVFHDLDRVFSTYRADSDLMRLRRGEVDLDACSPLVAQALALGEEAARRTGGAFTTSLPTADGGLALDLTGLVKGWAVDRAAEQLRPLARISFCINAGGDLLVGASAGLPACGPGAIDWRIGIEDPADRSRIATTVSLTAGAVATSGTAARGAHLYDPATGCMVGRTGSVTVVGPTLLWADVWATALFVGGGAASRAFAREAPGYRSLGL